MAYELYDTSTLLAVMSEQDAVPNYWLNLLFPNIFTFDEEWIDLNRIPVEGRKLAPFVAPLAQGRPIYSEGVATSRFKPAYIKPKDPVSPTRPIARRPQEMLRPGADLSPSERYDAVIADIAAYHRRAIERRWEWMAARAAIDGMVMVAGPDYPTRLVDFQRAAGHTITLAPGARFGDAGVSIIEFIQARMDQMHAAEFGGAPNRLTVGTTAWSKMRVDDEVKDLLDTTYRGGEATTLRRGLIGTGEVRYVGDLEGLEVYVYSDYYADNGVVTPFMDPRDIVLSGPAVDGYQCFGAILDPNAEYQPLPIYPSNWRENDPPVTFVMSQSAPLPVPTRPNATLKARVAG